MTAVATPAIEPAAADRDERPWRGRGHSSSSSSPIVPWPAAVRASSNAWTKTAPVSRSNASRRLDRVVVGLTGLADVRRGSARSLSSFARGALRGTKSVARSVPPSRSAAKATPSAWLPAEAATTPRARASASSDARRFVAPRTLNEPVGCQHSSFSSRSRARRAARLARRSGVGARCGRSVLSRAARRSSEQQRAPRRRLRRPARGRAGRARRSSRGSSHAARSRRRRGRAAARATACRCRRAAIGSPTSGRRAPVGAASTSPRMTRRVPRSASGTTGTPAVAAALKAPSRNGRRPVAAANVPSGKKSTRSPVAQRVVHESASVTLCSASQRSTVRWPQRRTKRPTSG